MSQNDKQLVNQNTPIFTVEDANRSRFLSAEDLFTEAKMFTIVGLDSVGKETTYQNGDTGLVTEFRVRLMDGTEGILSMGYNSRHLNWQDYFETYPDGRSELMMLAKGEQKKKGFSQPWIFVKGDETLF